MYKTTLTKFAHSLCQAFDRFRQQVYASQPLTTVDKLGYSTYDYLMADKEWDAEEALKALTMEKALEGLDDPHKLADRLFKENLSLAVMAICHLASYSHNEGMRFNAAKYVVDRSMGPADRMSTPTGKPAWEEVYEKVLTEATSYIKREETE